MPSLRIGTSNQVKVIASGALGGGSGGRLTLLADVDASTGAVLNRIMTLKPGEFAFFPINDGAGLEARADTASCIIEYAYWAKG